MRCPSPIARPRYAEFLQIAHRYDGMIPSDRSACMEAFEAHGLIPEACSVHFQSRCDREFLSEACLFYSALPSAVAAESIVRQHFLTRKFVPEKIMWELSWQNRDVYNSTWAWFGDDHTKPLFDLGVFLFPGDNDSVNFMPEKRFWLRLNEISK